MPVHSLDRTRGGDSATDETPSLSELEQDPHPHLARLRERTPVAWVPALGGWLVSSFALTVTVLRDAPTFTVDDPRFSTARLVGPSMLSLDGPAHARHRAPFASAFHHGDAAARLATFAEAEAARLVGAIRPHGAAEIRRTVSGPLAVAVVSEALGLRHLAPETILAAYERIVGGVTGLSGDQDPAGGGQPDPGAAAAFARLSTALRAVIEHTPIDGQAIEHGANQHGANQHGANQHGAMDQGEHAAAGHRSLLAEAARSGDLSPGEVISDAAVIMFGGIDTTDGMIANAVLHLLSYPDQLALVRVDPGLLPAAIEESLRLEPAAALLDRYATRDTELGGTAIRAGDRVSVSLAAANRDPAVFAGPDRFDIRRAGAGRHLAFAHGPHFCIGAPPARAETHAALRALLALPRLRLDPGQPTAPRGLVFRKPPTLHVTWDH